MISIITYIEIKKLTYDSYETVIKGRGDRSSSRIWERQRVPMGAVWRSVGVGYPPSGIMSTASSDSI